MTQQETVKQQSSLIIAGKVRDYMLLIKFSLSFMVVFSAVISYLLAPDVVEFNWTSILILFTGGMLVTGSANAVNQIMEKQTDAMMKRTAKRPVAAGRMSATEAWTFAVVALIAGLILLFRFGWLAAALALVSWFVYAYMY
jgi:protoheme IX farnesyltransferase